jgi:hypothetical protein
MSGQGLLGDASGNVFFMVGNGSTTASSGGSSYGNSFIKLAGNNLSLLDWFMPYYYSCTRSESAVYCRL